MTKNMVVSNTTFLHNNIHKQTGISPSRQIKKQIDHDIADRRLRQGEALSPTLFNIYSFRVSSERGRHGFKHSR